MNQEKIGLFIAECRKSKGYTQLQLAEKLGVTDRSISNWENGKCMPDLSLFKPLCEALDISIYELLSGERIEEDNIKKRTDGVAEKLVDMSSQKIRKTKVKFFLVTGIFTTIVLLFVVDILCISFFSRPLFAVRGSTPYMWKGLLYNTYICPEYTAPTIKLKGSKFSCSDNFTHKIDAVQSNATQCNTSPKLYYEESGRRVYIYCLDEVSIEYKDKRIDLLEFIKKHSSLDEAINKLTLPDASFLWDGGTVIYKDGGTTKYSNSGLTMIKCNRLEGRKVNRDIYFGSKDMEFKSNFCRNDNKTFVRTYRLENMKPYEEEYAYYLTLSEFQGAVDTVIVRNIFEQLEVGKNYEFELKKIPISKNVDDNMKDIFNNTEVISITETNRIGLEQRQDKMY